MLVELIRKVPVSVVSAKGVQKRLFLSLVVDTFVENSWLSDEVSVDYSVLTRDLEGCTTVGNG